MDRARENVCHGTYMPACPMQENQVRDEQMAAGMFYC